MLRTSQAPNYKGRPRLREVIQVEDERDRLADLAGATVLGLSAQETANIVGLTPTSVRITQHRALGKLRTALEREEGSSPVWP